MANKFEIKCTVLRINSQRKITDNLRLMEWVVSIEDGQYTQQVSIEFRNSNIDTVPAGIQQGDTINLTFRLNGRDVIKKGTNGELINFTKIEGLNVTKLK